ncbi:unnamed protein product [Orchesella dallaii]|uniref:Integrase catalytic domain-containing protein n=1 Tax=Orchesella dallaii TaxID=48710 RepID=A0ABP1PZL9_9HEXA
MVNSNLPNTIEQLGNPAVEYPGDLRKGVKRKRGGDKSAWQVTINRRNRMRGDEYKTYKLANSEESSSRTTKVERSKRALGPTCNSKICKKSQKRFCGQFSDESRQRLFNEFWRDLDWGQKRAYVISMVDDQKVERRGTGSNSRRKETFNYYLKLDGQKRKVCRLMFLNTLGLGKWQVREWVLHKQSNRKPRKSLPYKVSGKKASAKEFLDRLPKLPSHYCRQSTSKLYLEPMFSSMRQLYREYKNHCKERNFQETSWCTFHKLFGEMNISLYHPKKDKCDTCCSYESGNMTQADYEEHVARKTEARDEKANDTQKAMDGDAHVIVMDVQAVKVAPFLNASALYYKTKLAVHNFTLYDMVSRHVTCYLWDESEGEVVASVFATCLVKFLDRYNDDKPMIIYSDGCTPQNRNTMLSTALLDYAVTKGKIIFQKYMEKGHTQTEVDSVHSAIERNIKGKQIYIPQDYIGICEGARPNSKAYEVVYMKHFDFLDYSIEKMQRYTSIRPGNRSGDPCVTDLRQLRYDNNGSIFYKLKHSSDWSPLPRIPKNVSGRTRFPKLYSKRLSIPKRKYQDLLQLLHVIPQQHHDFYKLLSYK